MQARFTYDGKTIEVNRVPLRVSHEAEKALGVAASDGDTARLMVLLFAGIRAEFPDRTAVSIADEVMDFDLLEIDAEDTTEADPLGEPSRNGAESESRSNIGTLPSESAASPSESKTLTTSS